ncbi:dgat2l1-prov protein, putative, partial [Eimeria maxima]
TASKTNSNNRTHAKAKPSNLSGLELRCFQKEQRKAAGRVALLQQQQQHTARPAANLTLAAAATAATAKTTEATGTKQQQQQQDLELLQCIQQLCVGTPHRLYDAAAGKSSSSSSSSSKSSSSSSRSNGEDGESTAVEEAKDTCSSSSDAPALQQQQQQQQQLQLQLTDYLFGAYIIYAVACIFYSEQIGLLFGFPSKWHGVLSFSAFLGWGNHTDRDWINTDRFMPGIDIRLTTIAVNMRLPFWGHLLQALGGPGRAVLLVVGGAREALLGRKGENNLVLKRRKGIFELALQTGSWLIPVFSLGENDMYDWIDDEGLICKSLKFISRKTMAYFGFSLPRTYGRGLFQITMPKRVKIVQVVGDPLPVPHIANPTQKDIEELRQRYCEALQRVYDKARVAYGPEGQFADLRIVE